MTKKASTSISTKQEPWKWLKYKHLRNGNIQYQIKTEYALIICEYDPTKILQLMSTLFTDFFKKATAGKWSDTPLGEDYDTTLKEVLSARASYPKGPKGKVAVKQVKAWEANILKQYRRIPKDKISLITSRKWRSVVFDIVAERLKITQRSYAHKILSRAKRKENH